MPYAWNKELKQVHQVEENCVAKLLEIKTLMELYEQRVKKLAEMFQVEKLSMDSGEYRSQLEICMAPYYFKKVEIELLGECLTSEQLENLKELGYTNEMLLDLYAGFNEADKEFFAYLADGTEESYRKAFIIDPTTLTPEMSVAMADYARRLLTTMR